jgi:superfamily II DNA or RNA helicase
MSVNDFLYNYKLLNNDELISYLPDVSFNQSIFSKTEFNKLALPVYEPKPKPGELLNHQKIILRFLSSNTPYDELLLYHEVGTGKTCSAVGAIENIRRENFGFKKALILVKGKPLIDNFINELVFTCTDGRYIPENYDSLTDMEKTIRTRKMIEDFYEFNTFEVFAKKVNSLKDNQIRNTYNNTIVVVDEVHNLRPSDSTKEERSIYDQIHRFLHLLPNHKILLMSATPMKDKADEIATVMNLILPSDKQLPIDTRFTAKYLTDDEVNVPKRSMIPELSSYFRGRVSYLKAQQSDIDKVYEGKKVKGLKHLKVFEDDMSEFQTNIYKTALNLDVGEDGGGRKGIYNNSRQASLMVFPDGTYGSEGYKNYITEEKRLVEKDKFTYSFVLSREFKQPFENKTIDEKLDILRTYSTKYAEIIRLLLESREQNTFIYIDLVEGSGSVVFSKLLELFGYSKANGNEKTEGLRYALITNKTVTTRMIKSIVRTYNSPKNKNGGLIQVIIGSRMISEGITLKNVQNIHIVTPFWNYGDIDQAIGRGIRAFSHNALKEDLPEDENVKVRVYHHVAVPESGKSIDLLMYKTSEKKDVSIKAMEYLIKLSAFDCQLNKRRNERKKDNTRECEYKSCDYECEGITVGEYMQTLNDSYYNLYFMNDVNELKSKVVTLLANKYRLSFAQLSEELPDYTVFELLTVLNKLIVEKQLIICNNGMKGFLFEDNNTFYISDKIYSKNLFDNYYVNTPTFYTTESFDKIIDDELLNNMNTQIEELIRTQSIQILKNFPIYVQEMFLEAAVLANKKKISLNVDFRQFILDYYKDYIKKVDNITISTLLESSRGIIRCLDKFTWSDCNKDIQDQLEQEKTEAEENLENNKYGYYGIYKKDTDKFLIRDVTEKEFTETEDTREKTKGRACNTWKKSDLMRIILKLRLPSLDDTINSLDKGKLLALAKSKKYEKKLDKLGLDELSEYSEDDLRRILYFSTLKSAPICKSIYTFFEKNKLLLNK